MTGVVMKREVSGGAGVGLAVASAASFGTSGALAASLMNSGWSPGTAVTARVLLAAVILTGPALAQLWRQRAGLRRGASVITMYGLVAVAGAQLCYFNAIQHLPVAVALLLEYSGALLVVLWMWVRSGERPRKLTVAGGLLALLGLVLVLDLAGNIQLNLVGVAWGLGAAVGLAMYFVVSASTDNALPPLVVAWGGLTVGGIALLVAGVFGALPFTMSTDDVVLIGTQVSWLVPVVGLSLVAAAVAYVAGIVAARVLGAKVASFVGLTEVLFAVVFAWLLLGQVLTPDQLAGGVLVVAGIALVRVDELGGEVANSMVLPQPGAEVTAVR
jgi:drug/metabolite transporter (DMT)-like permease